jgi:aminoglycoside phosphotransferase
VAPHNFADSLGELLATLPPATEPTLIHGDYCFPNVLVHGRRLATIVDVGDLGVGDRWFDFAAVHMSGQMNLGADWDIERFMQAYGVGLDEARLDWFSRLYRLAFDPPGKS